MKCFVVYGTFGDLIVDRLIGSVLRYEPDRDSKTGAEYGSIVRFDIDEYAAAYPGEKLDHVDICDIGYWTKDGRYERPESDFRAQVSTDRAPFSADSH